MNKPAGAPNFKEIVCPVCKKIFFASPGHLYKMNGNKSSKRVCSYGCSRLHVDKDGNEIK